LDLYWIDIGAETGPRVFVMWGLMSQPGFSHFGPLLDSDELRDTPPQAFGTGDTFVRVMPTGQWDDPSFFMGRQTYGFAAPAITPVPEPTSGLMLLSGLGIFSASRRLRRHFQRS
jgi:hypothetical protein